MSDVQVVALLHLKPKLVGCDEVNSTENNNSTSSSGINDKEISLPILKNKKEV